MIKDFDNITADDIRNTENTDIDSFTIEQKTKYAEALKKYSMLMRTVKEPIKAIDLFEQLKTYTEEIENGALLEVKIKDEECKGQNILSSSTVFAQYDKKSNTIIIQNFV